MKRGTGEAFLIVREHPGIDFTNEIMEGALRNFAYDGQSEPERASYILGLMQHCSGSEMIKKAVIDALATENDDTWTLTHLFAQTKLFAASGDVSAHEAIYRRFLNKPIEGSEWVGYQEILELDGLKGLFYIAEAYGKMLESKPGSWTDDMIVKHYQALNQEINVWEQLEKESKQNSNVLIFLTHIKDSAEAVELPAIQQSNYADITEEIVSNPFISIKRITQLTRNELQIIATRFENEKSYTRKERLLSVFRQHPYPLNSEDILTIAISEKGRLRDCALDVLCKLKSDNVRKYAINQLQSGKQPELYAGILGANFRAGDEELMSVIAERIRSDHKIESLTHTYLDIFNRNRSAKCSDPLSIIYRKTRCGICRHNIVEMMLENNCLPEQIKKEIVFDCNEKTQQLVD